jgi:hypothetical protein
MKLELSNFILKAIGEVEEELSNKGIAFRPKYYISDEWGCPNKVPIIGIPYSYCYPILKVLEEDKVIHNGDSVDSILRILCHEVGHVINYAYMLYMKSGWKEHFGNFNKPYNLNEAVKYANPFTKDFVVNLPDYNYCYAQLHPDEDFSETFAVWLSTNSSSLFTLFWSGKALNKLLYLNMLMHIIKNKQPLISGGRRHKPFSKIILKRR